MSNRNRLLIVVAVLVLICASIADVEAVSLKQTDPVFSSKLVALPKAAWILRIGYAEQPALLEVIHRFARQANFKFVDGGQGLTDGQGRPIVNIDLVRKDGTVVSIVGINVDVSGFFVAVYARKEMARWKSTADALKAKLEKHWPGKLTQAPSLPPESGGLRGRRSRMAWPAGSPVSPRVETSGRALSFRR